MREDEEDDEFESWVYMFDDSDGSSSEFIQWVSNKYVMAELCIRYDWVIYTLRLSYTYITVEFTSKLLT